MYLLLFEDMSMSDRRWLTQHAIQVSPLAWVHNASIPGTTSVRLNNLALLDLSVPIDSSSIRSMKKIEEKVRANSLRGSSKDLSLNTLNLIIQATTTTDVIWYAKSLVRLISGKGYVGPKDDYKDPEHEKNEDQALGIDEESVKEYILRLAKEPSIH
tara:strand:+ start:714 stop:1184 length:471 start_codon:yes stop_codon:yes gene_type:complete